MKPSIGIAFATAVLFAATPSVAAPDWEAVDAVLGRPGTEQPGGIHRYSFPRSDLGVTLDGIRIEPAFALGSWLAFHEIGNKAVVMGDLVLTQEEVNPVLSRLLQGGVTITALHNHLLRSEPTTMYMHIHGQGDPATLAKTVRTALAASHTPLTPPAAGDKEAPPALDVTTLDRIMRAKGQAGGGVYKFAFPRAESITDHGISVPAAMGLATSINFQPAATGKAAATGDFVLVESEITPVLTALRQNGIEVTALHNHLTGEQPRLFFMHFWGDADPEKLAAGLRQALDRMNLAAAR